MIKKKTFAVSNDGIPPAMDPKSLQCRVTLLDGEEIVQDFNVSVPDALKWTVISRLSYERRRARFYHIWCFNCIHWRGRAIRCVRGLSL